MFQPLRLLAFALALFAAPAWAALDPASVLPLADEDPDVRIEAIRKLTATQEPRVADILGALSNEALGLVDGGRRAVIVADGRMSDAATGAPLGPVPAGFEPLMVNNRLRGEIDAALAALKLASPDAAARLAAAKSLQGSDNDGLLPIVQQALDKEGDGAVKGVLQLVAASLALKNADPDLRAKAAAALGKSDDPQVRQVLSALLAKGGDGAHAEPDERVRAAAQLSLAEIDRRLFTTEIALSAFTGLSLGSILLLAALGLAITYGLMGIINMAHGEFLMIGAYTTFLVQGAFRHYFPGAFDWYVVAALPAAFVVTAVIGMALERSVLRWLYGRPLETLLTTWGVSLLLIQASRSLFGAQNVEVGSEW